MLNNSQEKDDIQKHLCIDKIFWKMQGGTFFFSHTVDKKRCVTQCVCVIGCSRDTRDYVGSSNFVGVAVEQGSSVYTIV